jgi:molecular chaperone DnaK (HSP70)
MRAIRGLPSLSCVLLLLACTSAADEPLLVVRGSGPGTGPDGKTTEAIGMESLGGFFTPLLAKHCAVPCSKTEIFTTAGDGQTQITIKLYRGDTRLASQATLLGDFRIERCVSGPRGGPQIALTLATRGPDLTLRAEEQRTRKPCRIVLAR